METNPTVLIIDDDPRYTEMLDIALSCEGFEPIIVHDSRQAHQLASEVQPDIIVSDIAMPQLDGYAVVAGLKSDPLTAGIPILLVTAGNPMPGDLNSGGLDYDSFITKPFSVPMLVERIRAILAKSKMKEVQ